MPEALLAGSHEFSCGISTSNHMFGKAIWNKLPKCVFESFETARVKREPFQNFQKLQIYPKKPPEPNM